MFSFNQYLFPITSIFFSYKYIEGTLKWVSTLDIYGKYSKAERQQFPCPQQIINTCGFVKTYENFSMFWIMNAGHMVSYSNIIFLILNINMINLRYALPKKHKENEKKTNKHGINVCFIQDILLETLNSKLYRYANLNKIVHAL